MFCAKSTTNSIFTSMNAVSLSYLLSPDEEKTDWDQYNKWSLTKYVLFLHLQDPLPELDVVLSYSIVQELRFSCRQCQQ